MSELQATKNKVSYEMYTLMSTQTSEEDLSKLQENIVKILENSQAHVQKVGQFVRSNLAYPIKKDRSAYVSTIKFVADPGSIEEVKKLIDLLDTKPMRYLVTKEEKRREEKRRRVKPTTGNFVQEEKIEKPTEILEKKEEKNLSKPETSSDSVDNSKDLNKTEKETEESEKEEKVTLDDIDKKLDEIMGNL